jgi:hypothetical protein
MSVEHMPDGRLARYYENIRQQVEAERACKYKFMTNPTPSSVCPSTAKRDDQATFEAFTN